MAAIDVMFDVCFDHVCLPEHIRKKSTKPGETYQNLPESVKDKLKELTSDDLCSMRPDLVQMLTWTDQDCKREQLHKLLVDFDAKMNRL